MERMLQELDKRGGGLLPEQRDAAAESLRKVVHQARTLSDAEYSLKADELAEEISNWDRHTAARRTLEQTVPGAMMRRNVEAFLLDPRIPALLDERSRTRALAPQGSLKDVPPAESCENGGCALPQKPGTRRPKTEAVPPEVH